MNYQLIIKVPIEAIDDIDARQKAKQIYSQLKGINDKIEAKLQEIYIDKQPRGISVNFTGV